MFFNYTIVIVNTLPAHKNFNGYSVKFLKISDIQLQIIIIFGVIKYNVTYLKLKTPPTTYKFFHHFKTILILRIPNATFCIRFIQLLYLSSSLLHDHIRGLVLIKFICFQYLTSLLVVPGQHQGQLTQDTDPHQLIKSVVWILLVNKDK